MNDEGTTDFRDNIEQMDTGLTFIYENFKVIPETAWQIDPFGHSAATVSIMRKLGFTSIMLNRISTVKRE